MNAQTLTLALRTRRHLLVVGFVLALGSLLALPVYGQEAISASLSLDVETIQQANRLETTVPLASLRVDSNTLVTPGELSLKVEKIENTPLPTHLEQVSEFWVFDVKPTERVALLPKAVTIVLPYTSKSFGKPQAYIGLGNSWRRLWSQDHPDTDRLTIRTRMPYGQIVVVEDSQQLEGVASWYGSRVQMGAAMNVVPLGSKVKVTNLENKKSVVVTVVSRGPFVDGRVIDLTAKAFSVIASKSAGVARVSVLPLSAKTAVAAPVVSSAKPTLSSAAAIVINPADSTATFAKNADQPRSLASITKLMTALVFLESKPTLGTIVSMVAEDVPKPEAGAVISVGAGQTLSIKDVFYSTITGSANNAARALVRLSGLTEAAFIARMNAKAVELGLTNTHFEDPTGLAVGNVSTAADIAKLAAAAFANPTIRDAGSKASYQFKVRSNGVPHKTRHPLYLYNKLLNTAPIVTAKTGFINEAGQCVAFIATGANGKEYITVLLGAPGTTTRARDALALMKWAGPQF